MSNDSPRDGAPAPVPTAEHEQGWPLYELQVERRHFTLPKEGEYTASGPVLRLCAAIDAALAAALPHAPSPPQELTKRYQQLLDDSHQRNRLAATLIREAFGWLPSDRAHALKAKIQEFLVNPAAHAPSPPTGWQPLDVEHLPKGRVLLTNNLKAVDAHGRKSHVWYGFAIKASHPDDDGLVITYDDADRKIHFLTHYAVAPLPAPVAPHEDTKK